MICDVCGRQNLTYLIRCGYEDPDELASIGCHKLICLDCIAGYWLPDIEGKVRRPLCKDCIGRDD